MEPALLPALEAAVMLHILEIRKRGGPTDHDFDRARELADVIASGSDVLMFRGQKRGETARQFAATAFAIAVMAFVPGGVTVFGRRYNA